MPKITKPVRGDKPDITAAQILAVVGSLLAFCAAFGLDLSKEQSEAIMDLAKQLSALLIGSDLLLRTVRNLTKKKD